VSSVAILSNLLVGPAVVVDDTLEIKNSPILAVVEQIEGADIPIMKLESLPDIAQVKHWRGFSMIILDWELLSDAPGDEPLPPGLSLPAMVVEENDELVSRFVQAILDELYCPVFIVSSLDVTRIEQTLVDRLGITRDRLSARVFIKSKASSQAGFLDDLANWIKAHPAVYALRSWERDYEEAKRSLFADFEESSITWPQILWKTATADAVNESVELAETLSRNLFHRMSPAVFDPDLIAAAGEFDRASLHRVLHGQAVIPGTKLAPDVLMPGDFFYEPTDDGSPPLTIFINLTAACDLVARDGAERDKLKMQIVEAKLMVDRPHKEQKIKDMLERERSTNQLLHHLTPHGEPYDVKFSSHSVATWKECGPHRQGRLLPPYITMLQQKFALYLLRPGLPRLPLEFYFPE